MISDARANLSLLGTQIDLKHHEFVGVRMGLSSLYCCHLELDLPEFID
jgi:hypothetical protein